MLSYPILVSDVARPLKDRFTYQINPSINKVIIHSFDVSSLRDIAHVPLDVHLVKLNDIP